MNPTNILRFVVREVPAPGAYPHIVKTVRVLQQWWERDEYSPGEWRDVPLEVEE